MVTDDLPWIQSTANWLQGAIKSSMPILGICFGHQLLAKTLGGRVDDNPNGIEVGTVKMTVSNDNNQLLAIFPKSLGVQVSHQQSVLTLPEGAVRLAKTEMDGNHAFCFGDNVWGIQFHPEFTKPIVEKYIEYYQEEVEGKFKDNPAREAVGSTKILQQFAKLVGQ